MVNNMVCDTDSRFVIDTASKEITNTCGKKAVNQFDHNSERYTFEISRFVDGFDLLTCNVVEIHFTNTNYKDKTESNSDVYKADDLRICPDDPGKVICSWLISENATQYPGSLHFQVKYKMVDTDGSVLYRWQTKTYTKCTVLSSIDGGNGIVETHPDVLLRLDALEKAINENAVIVTASEIDSVIANMNSEQIMTHIINGDTVYLSISEMLLPVFAVIENDVLFSIWVDNKHIVYGIDRQAIIYATTAELITAEMLHENVGNIETALDSIISIQESLIGGAAE